MKHHVFFAFLLVCFWGIGFSKAQAQGTLQFNQVKLVTNQETVPAGKVWKVVSVVYNIPLQTSGDVSSTSSSCGSSTYYSRAIVINGINTKTGRGLHTASYSSLAYAHGYTELPLWLPAGATLSGGPCLNQVSVIEFNVLP